MIRRLLVVLLVVAVGLGVVAYDRQRDRNEIARQSECPAGLANDLPTVESSRGQAPARVQLTEVAQAEAPVAFATRAGDPALYVAEQAGRVLRIDGGRRSTVIDLTDEVALSYEQGLLGLVFSPDGTKLYTDHTGADDDTRITEWSLPRDEVATDRREVLRIEDHDPVHNAGQLAFGPDGYLYIGHGDGGGLADPDDNGQSTETLLGKILRIDPRPSGDEPYQVPGDNPFVGDPEKAEEIWAYGLRNPWRFSFDARTGDLWIADVGQYCFEEIDIIRAGTTGAPNFGWDKVEGPWVLDAPAPDGHAAPDFVYRVDTQGVCGVIGGFVYRGQMIPGLRGWYVFGDLCRGEVLAWRGPGKGDPVPLGVKTKTLVSFGVDPGGELYTLSLEGQISRVVPARSAG